jgi:hypothetical protein
MERDGLGLVAGALIGVVSLILAGTIIAAAAAVLTFVV